MVSSKDILKATGIKSSRTLTRWYQRGVIPEPAIATHPSGRGKISYWPDWVLDKCIKIAGLLRKGHTLSSAEDVLFLQDRGPYNPSIETNVKDWRKMKMSWKLPDNDSLGLEEYILKIIKNELIKYIRGQKKLEKILNRSKTGDLLSIALDYLNIGRNPLLIYEDNKVKIVTNCAISLLMDYYPKEQEAILILPLAPILLKALRDGGIEIPFRIKYIPAPKFWEISGGAIMEYSIGTTGPLGTVSSRVRSHTLPQTIGFVPEMPDGLDNE